jgi:hypothetical protein
MKGGVGVTEICHMTLLAHALKAERIMFESLTNERHFTLEAETVCRSYLPSHSIAVTENCHTALPVHSLQTLQVRLKSVSSEGIFSLRAETVFAPYLPSHCSVVTEMCHMALSAHASRAVQVTLKSVTTKGTLPLWPKQILVRMYTRIAMGWLISPTLHSIRIRYKQCNLVSLCFHRVFFIYNTDKYTNKMQYRR